MEQLIKTRFTERFGVEHPIMLAPMDLVAGGRLAAAVTQAGGLGMIGGGYGDRDWLAQQFADAGNQPVGVGFITWSLLEQAELLPETLARAPRAFMVSFGDAEPLIEAARAKGVPTLWQVQRLAQAEQALAAGVDTIVVQGQEAGGHGMDRGLMALLPAVRDLAGSDSVILAAGGIADGRGLAAALMLGADGVALGTRFWASEEAAGPDSAKRGLVATGGDETVRTKVFDVARNAKWPEHFTGRVVRNAFCRHWHHRIEELKRQAESEQARYLATDPEDFETRVLIAGEALDFVQDIPPAARIVEDTVRQAANLLRGASATVLA